MKLALLLVPVKTVRLYTEVRQTVNNTLIYATYCGIPIITDIDLESLIIHADQNLEHALISLFVLPWGFQIMTKLTHVQFIF